VEIKSSEVVDEYKGSLYKVRHLGWIRGTVFIQSQSESLHSYTTRHITLREDAIEQLQVTTDLHVLGKFNIHNSQKMRRQVEAGMDRTQARDLLDMPEISVGLHHAAHPYTDMNDKAVSKRPTCIVQDAQEAQASERRAVSHSQGVGRNLGQDAAVTSDGGASNLHATMYV
jgi:hypothetical protein